VRTDTVRRGYHTFMSSFGKVFHVEKRWKLVREMGSGAYGVVVCVHLQVANTIWQCPSHSHMSRSAVDQISGQTVAIKLVTRIFEKTQLAKRALREITLLRHFANHENITGLIDMDAISPDFQEMFVFLLLFMYAQCSLVRQIHIHGGAWLCIFPWLQRAPLMDYGGPHISPWKVCG